MNVENEMFDSLELLIQCWRIHLDTNVIFVILAGSVFVSSYNHLDSIKVLQMFAESCRGSAVIDCIDMIDAICTIISDQWSKTCKVHTATLHFQHLAAWRVLPCDFAKNFLG